MIIILLGLVIANMKMKHRKYIWVKVETYILWLQIRKIIEDFFCLEDIEDEEYIGFHFDMLDVGDKYSNPDRYKTEEIVMKCSVLTEEKYEK